MPASSKHTYGKTLAFPDTYYGLIINLLQSVELFCAYGKRIKIIRNARNITQEKLAEMSKLTLAHISNIENGHSKMSIDSLIAISNALSVSTDTILFGEITYDKEPYYKEFADIMLDCSDNKKNILCRLLSMQSSSYMISNLKLTTLTCAKR